MIEEFKFPKDFKFYKDNTEYWIRATPTEDHPVYRVLVTNLTEETCLEKYLTYPQIVYIMFGAE